jgi:hypothetical protein
MDSLHRRLALGAFAILAGAVAACDEASTATPGEEDVPPMLADVDFSGKPSSWPSVEVCGDAVLVSPRERIGISRTPGPTA